MTNILAITISAFILSSNISNAATCDNDYSGIYTKNIEVQICKQYAIGYDFNLKSPLWVAYNISSLNSVKNTKRLSSFRADYSMSRKNRAYTSWYRKSGYDRGHMAPANAFRYSKSSERSTFIMSNIVPQLPSVNRGIWKALEHRTLKYGSTIGEVTVITGPIYNMKALKTVRKLALPVAFYKIIIDKSRTKSISFMIPNVKPPKKYKLSQYIVTIDNIEFITSIDFLHDLSLSKQNILESSVANVSDWPIIIK